MVVTTTAQVVAIPQNLKRNNMREKTVKTETTSTMVSSMLADTNFKKKIVDKQHWLQSSYIVACSTYLKSSKKQDRDNALQIKAKLDLCNELLK